VNATADKKLRALLEHARASCAHWARLLPPPDDVLDEDTSAVLARLPLLDRRTLHYRRAQLMSVGDDTRGWRVIRTTGTSGEPIEMFLDRRARAAETEALTALFDRITGGRTWRESDLVTLALHAGAASRTMPAPWNPSVHASKWNLIRIWQLDDRTIAECLQRLDGCVVSTLPSVFELLLARLTKAGSRAPRLRAVLLSGEMVSTELALLGQDVFKCPVTAAYTLTEAGIVATACATDGGYRVEHDAVVVEIIDGEIVVTPLDNFALPLFRYRTGDRGAWLPPCGCGRSEPRLALLGGRRPARLVGAEGRTLNVVRFNKLLTEIDVERILLEQAADGTVVVAYEAERPMAEGSRQVVTAAIRCALGPKIAVRFERRRPINSPHEDFWVVGSVEPAGTGPAELLPWLRCTLSDLDGLVAAALTGSSLDPAAMTRFSDIDLMILVSGDPCESRWIELARTLRRHLASLSPHVDAVSDLPRRAPLLTCRLLSEHLDVLGHMDEQTLPWPTMAALRAEARIWAQTTTASLAYRLADPQLHARDLVREAAVAARHAVDALRFRGLLNGLHDTAATRVLERAKGARHQPWLDGILEAWDVAREHRPPPPPGDGAGRWLAAALACVRAAELQGCEL
jgi:phenylacetate-coenzyme A ligase PaaK-like adenylate-forming protein